MGQMGRRRNEGHGNRARAAYAGLLVSACCLLAPSAQAAPYEGVGHFAGSATPLTEEQIKANEEIQLGGVGGMAVNYTGAGGVEPGTLYAASYMGGEVRIAMFTPQGEGLELNRAWEVTYAEEAYEICGPKAEEPLHPTCPIGVSGQAGGVDVDVNQSTGNVYVMLQTLGTKLPAGGPAIVEYTPDGSEVITRFAAKAAEGKTTAETPDRIHSSVYPGAIAVNDAGEVYLFDVNNSDSFYHRLMVFKPKTPGDYSEYEFAGEVAAGFFGEGEFPTKPVADAAGNVYVAGDEYIEMYEPEAPQAYPGKPAKVACRFDFAKGGIGSITVDPESGEVFFFSYKKETGFALRTVRRLAPCDPASGKFKDPASGEEITGQIEVSPERDFLWALAFDPERTLTGSSPGVLYGGAPGPVPDIGKGEPGQSSLGYVFAAKAEEAPPLVGSGAVKKVTQTTAQLRATVDPKLHSTHYAFQYLTEAAYQEAGESFTGAAETGGGSLEGTGPQVVGTTLTGLVPDTAYRFQAVAESNCDPGEPGKVCEVVGEALGFHTFPEEAPGLPDDRAYEMVSPAQKNGGQVFPADWRFDSCPGGEECKPGGTYTHFPMQASPDGEAVVYEGDPFSAGGGAAIENQYKAVRTASGWQSTNLSPPLMTSNGGAGYKAFDPELTQGVLEQRGTALSPAAPAGFRNIYSQPTAEPLALGSLLAAEPPNRPASGGTSFELAYADASSDLSRIFFAANDVLTVATPFAPAAIDGGADKDNLYEWQPASGELRLVNVAPGNTETEPGASFGAGSANAISDDGARAFWSDEAGQLYVREDAEATSEIPDSGKFLAAATDGSRVLLDNGHVYDLEAEETIDLTEGEGGFEGLVGQSDDLTSVYFIDTAVLDEAPNSEGDAAEAGESNLYSWEGEGTTRYVATLVAQDNGSGSNDLTKSWNRSPSARTAQASPNGRFVAFLSRASLTGYDNAGPCEETGGGEILTISCPEAFLYDSASETLTCASCNPSGVAPLGWTVLRQIGGAPPFMAQPRYLTDSGRLYFDSRDSLSPRDTNEGVEDVYQYEPEGLGSCGREGGCINLISAGTGAVDSNFLAIDETGENVFFTTRDRLVGADADESFDLYVAREGGGIAAEAELPQGSCQGEGCQPPLSAIPGQLPASATFSGSGNVAPERSCKRSQVKRKGRCVKRKHSHKKKKKHARKQAANRNGGAK